MNNTYIVTVYCMIDDVRASISAAEILTVAVVAATYLRKYHGRALGVLIQFGDILPVNVSLFNRRLHGLSDRLYGIVTYWANGSPPANHYPNLQGDEIASRWQRCPEEVASRAIGF